MENFSETGKEAYHQTQDRELDILRLIMAVIVIKHSVLAMDYVFFFSKHNSKHR